MQTFIVEPSDLPKGRQFEKFLVPMCSEGLFWVEIEYLRMTASDAFRLLLI